MATSKRPSTAMIGHVSSARSRKTRVTQTPEVTPEESLTGKILTSRQNNTSFLLLPHVFTCFFSEERLGLVYPNTPIFLQMLTTTSRFSSKLWIRMTPGCALHSWLPLASVQQKPPEFRYVCTFNSIVFFLYSVSWRKWYGIYSHWRNATVHDRTRVAENGRRFLPRQQTYGKTIHVQTFSSN